MLWTRPDVDARAHRELTEVLRGRPPTLEDLPRLSYCSQVLRETGRFFAPAPILYREVETPLSVDEHVLEPGAWVWICPRFCTTIAQFPEPRPVPA